MKKEDFPNQPWFPAIKAGQRDLIAAVGTQPRVADFLGVSKGLVGFWANWDLPDLMPQWAMIRLEAERGRPILSRAYAELTGATVMELARKYGGASTLGMEMARLGIEYAEAVGSHAEAAADLEYTVHELRDIRAKLVDMANQAHAAIAKVDEKIAVRLTGAS